MEHSPKNYETFEPPPSDEVEQHPSDPDPDHSPEHESPLAIDVEQPRSVAHDELSEPDHGHEVEPHHDYGHGETGEENMLEHLQAHMQRHQTRGVRAPERMHRPSVWRLLLTTLAFLGCQVSWAVQIGFTTPTLRELGMPHKHLSFVWLAGPISGILVQPIVGILSDRSTSKLGRRRPFLIFGTVFVVAALLLFGNAESLGQLLGDSEVEHPIGLIIASVSFWVLDFAINVLQGPLRALLTDIAEPDQLPLGNALFALNNGIGKVVGYGLGSLALVNVFPMFETHLRSVYTIAAVIVVIVVACTCFGTPEQQHILLDASGFQSAIAGGCANLYRALVHLPKPIVRAFIVQSCTFFSWFCTFIYLSDWFGDPEALPGTPARTLFDEGVKMGNFGLMLMAAVSIPFSLLMPKLIAFLGLKLVWCGSMLIMAACLGLCALPGIAAAPWVGLVICAGLGLPLAATYSLGWSVVTHSAASTDDRGLLTTLFNLSQCFPEIVMALLGGTLVTAFGGELGRVLAVGGAGALCAAAASWFVIVPHTWNDRVFWRDWGERRVRRQHSESFSTLRA